MKKLVTFLMLITMMVFTSSIAFADTLTDNCTDEISPDSFMMTGVSLKLHNITTGKNIEISANSQTFTLTNGSSANWSLNTNELTVGTYDSVILTVSKNMSYSAKLTINDAINGNTTYNSTGIANQFSKNTNVTPTIIDFDMIGTNGNTVTQFAKQVTVGGKVDYVPDISSGGGYVQVVYTLSTPLELKVGEQHHLRIGFDINGIFKYDAPTIKSVYTNNNIDTFTDTDCAKVYSPNIKIKVD